MAQSKNTQGFDASRVYADIYKAFDYYNKKLFAASLPRVVISIRAKANSVGYFAPDRFKAADNKKESAHEIAFNPVLLNRPIKIIFSTLVHEMAHLWQEKFGTPSKSGYHNKEWADKMESVGLMPESADGLGKRTGSKMSHSIMEGEIFDRTTEEFISKNEFNFFYELPEMKVKRDNSKAKFTCPSCGCNAWGKSSLRLICGDCDEVMEVNE